MGQEKYQGLLNEHGRFNGVTRLDETALMIPLKTKKPTTFFVNSMSDLFHESIPDAWIDKVFAVMALCRQHRFQVLTKRADRMERYFQSKEVETRWMDASPRPHLLDLMLKIPQATPFNTAYLEGFALTTEEILDAAFRVPLPNVWLGVSAENQAYADARIPRLLETPAAVRFVSAEPLLEPITLTSYLKCESCLDPQICWCVDPKINLVIVGGESGPAARKCHADWIRLLVNQCQGADVPVFVKQLGSNVYVSGLELTERTTQLGRDWQIRDRKGGNPNEWPEDLRVREMPQKQGD